MCVGAWIQFLFDFIGFDDVDFVSPGEAFGKWGDVRYVFVLVPSKNVGYEYVPVDKADNNTDGVMVTEKSEVTNVETG